MTKRYNAIVASTTKICEVVRNDTKVLITSHAHQQTLILESSKNSNQWHHQDVPHPDHRRRLRPHHLLDCHEKVHAKAVPEHISWQALCRSSHANIACDPQPEQVQQLQCSLE